MKLVFITGNAIRRVIIQGRIITLLAAETSNKPVTINLDEIDSHANNFDKMKLNEEDIVTIKKLTELGSEEEIAQDIIKDFQKTGWRLIKKIE